MNIPMISMDREGARQRLRALRTQLHRRSEAEYEALRVSYEQLVEGRPVLALAQVLAAGGIDADGRPRLAIARADRRQVHVRRFGNGSVEFSTRPWQRNGWGGEIEREWLGMLIRVDVPDLPAIPAGVPERWRERRGFALVPLVPSEVVNLVGGTTNLRHFYTLFEVEAWADARLRAQPDRDPFLLRDLGFGMYGVIAQWDLTELERTVMGLFRR
jgi:hypothetical protein